MSRRFYIHCDFKGCEAESNVTEAAFIPKDGGSGWFTVRSAAHMNKEIDLCPEHANLLGLS